MATTEKDITLCGHGSGHPSTKNMNTYLSSRYKQKASNGKRKGIIKVMRLKALTDAKRKEFHDTYKTILGRNNYNQSYRSYVYTKRSDGKYYSDCSSSGMATFKKIGYNVPLLNTAGIYNSPLFEEVSVKIKDGHITNPEILKVGDALLFVGSDPKRPLQIGHVEYVYEIKSSNSSSLNSSKSSTSSVINSSNSKKEIIKKGQEHAINFTGIKIEVDGIVGKDTNKMKSRVLQHAMNLDYGKTIEEDGEFGEKSKSKLGSHYIEKGEKQYMVTAAEILMMLNGIDPNGVEKPGIYGNGLVIAAKTKFGNDGLKITASEFMKLI